MTKRDEAPRAGIFSRRRDVEDSPRGTTRRRVIAVGAFGFVSALAGLAGVAPAWADDYPSWDDVEKAKANEADKNAEIKKIKNLIASLENQVADTQAAAEKAGQAYYDAQLAYSAAVRRADDLQSQADDKSTEADKAITQAGQLAAQLYRTGGDNASLSLIFDATGAGPDALLAALGSMSKLLESNQAIYEAALTAKNTAQSLSDQASVARDERDKLQKEAETAYNDALTAAQAAADALAAQEDKQAELEAQLEALQDTTKKTVAEYKKGVEERRKAAEAAKKAAEEAARKAAEEAANNAGSGGGGSSGGGGGGGSSTGTGWAKPCYGWISSYYGPRSSPGGVGSTYHEGIDIAAAYDAPIYAAAAGTVEYAGVYGGYGNYVLINHGGNVYTGYGHIHAGGIHVSVGQSVGAGAYIAGVGSTGNSTGNHVHFEIRTSGRWSSPINPIPFMNARGIYW